MNTPILTEDLAWLRNRQQARGTKINQIPGVAGFSDFARSPLATAARAEASVVVERTGSAIELVRDLTLPVGGFAIQNRSGSYLIRASDPSGILYGLFALDRNLRVGQIGDFSDAPKIALRILNHWDNLHPRTDIERGYGGNSLFDWNALPELNPRYHAYARLLASIGINGIILNNVNAGEPGIGGYRLLDPEWIPKLDALAGVFRGWGIRVGISIAFSSPVLFGDLETDDPRDPRVADWWRQRTDAIYEAIPDFLGYLIKADCEGQPGPMRHGLDHAAGSQAIASALEPHGGRLFWRAFVYDDGRGLDIVAQPYAQFKPLDGKFPANVSVQIKYGPRDFQPREPIHPLLGALEHTATALELQITQEYLGHDNHAVFLPSLWEEILQSPTPNGTTLAGFLADAPDAAMVGVSNVSDAPNWTGHLLAQANLYGFGRLAWNPQLTAATIAREWVSLTFGQDPLVNKNLSEILLRSHEIFVGYTAPFALGQVHGNGPSWDLCHYDPDPARKNGTDLFRADADGIGIDRTLASGSGVLEQYCPTLQKLFNDPQTCPPGLLLWFHRLPWDHLLPDGRTLAEAIHASYFDSANEVEHFISLWNELEGKIDDASFRHVAEKFRLQRQHAWHWATTMTAYFEKLRAPEPKLSMAV